MKNLNIIFYFLVVCLFVISCNQNNEKKTKYDQAVGQTINTFYGDALEFKESYNLLRVLSKDIGQRLSGSEGAKKAVQWTKKVMEDYGFDTVYLQEVMVPHWERGELEEAYFYNGKDKINLRRELNIPETSFLIGSFQKDGNGWGRGEEPKLIKGPDIFLEVIEVLKNKVDNLLSLSQRIPASIFLILPFQIGVKL